MTTRAIAFAVAAALWFTGAAACGDDDTDNTPSDPVYETQVDDEPYWFGEGIIAMCIGDNGVYTVYEEYLHVEVGDPECQEGGALEQSSE